MSPFSSFGASCSIVESTYAAGTISQIARGLSSFETNSSIDFAPVAPSFASASTAAGVTS